MEFVKRRLEEASLPHACYSAAFSGSAIHWVDPDVSWRKTADALVDRGALALVSYFGLAALRSAGDQQALRAAMASVAPGLGADWPTYRDLDGTLGGVDERRGNVSDVWAWLVGYELARGYAADLFDDTQVAAVPTLLEHTADALNALLGTMSFWARLSPRSATLCAPRTRLSTKARPADLLQHRRLPGNGATRSAHLTAVRHLAPGRRTQAITCRHCGNWIAFPVPPPRGGRSPSPRPELRGLSGQTCAFGPARPRPEPWSRRRPRPGCSPISA